MANFEFRLPDIGEGVTEGEIVSWLVNPGDAVQENQDIVEVMTDKATVTISAPRRGNVSELRGKPGDVVPVGSVLVVFDIGEGSAPLQVGSGVPAAARVPASERALGLPKASISAGSESARVETVASAVGDLKAELPGTELYGTPSTSRAPAGTYYSEKPLAAPAVRKLARELGVDLRRVAPSGKSGQVTREDVERFHGQRGQSASSDELPPPVVPPEPPAAAEAEGGRTPIRGLRKRIYENMARAKRTAAHFTYVDECDVTEFLALHRRMSALAAEQGVKLSYLPFIAKAVVSALRKHPALHCLVDDAAMEMVHPGTFDIGIAMATEAGLIVPVLRGADKLGILGIAREIQRLASGARAGKTRSEDLGGSSFSITSLGKQGGLFATPVVNYPEVAILGVHEIKRRPVVKDDQIVIGQVMLLSLSFDHRIIDGHIGAAFAQEIIRYLESPELLLLDG